MHRGCEVRAAGTGTDGTRSSSGLMTRAEEATPTGGSEGISLSGMSGALVIGSVDIDAQTGDGIDITSSPGRRDQRRHDRRQQRPGRHRRRHRGWVRQRDDQRHDHQDDRRRHRRGLGPHGWARVDLNGLLTSTNGGGVDLTGNTGATIRFDGGITLSTGAATAFNATGGGIAITGAANTLTTGTGTALNVQDTTIHSDDLTFRSISVNGAANGIVLSNTGLERRYDGQRQRWQLHERRHGRQHLPPRQGGGASD